MGRSVRRAARMAASDGRDSRLMKPPGILPAAYMRSSNSTVSGKKSRPGLGSERLAVPSSMVSPERTVAAPPASSASLPVSMVSVRPPISAVRVVTGISPPMSEDGSCLAAQSEAADDGAIAGVVLAHQVRKQPPSLPDELEQTATRVIVLGKGTQMLGQALDPFRQERDLDLR